MPKAKAKGRRLRRVLSFSSWSPVKAAKRKAVMAELSGTWLTAESVCDRARKKSSALHDCGAFTWDDAEAAEERRLEQARALIRSIIGEWYEPRTGRRVMGPVRAYQSTAPYGKGEKGRYVLADYAMQHENLAERVYQNALLEFECFRVKHGHLKQLRRRFAAWDAAD